MRDRIVSIIVALAGVGFCAAGIKVAWWLVARILEGITAGDLVKVIGIGFLTYLGGAAVVVILIVLGIALLAAAIDN